MGRRRTKAIRAATLKGAIPLIWLLRALPAAADVYPRQPEIDVIHYEIGIEVSDTSDQVEGTTRVQVMARRDGVSKMWLDFETMAVEDLKVGGVNLPFVHRDGRLSFELDRRYREREIVVIEVRYRGEPSGKGLLIGRNKHGRRVYFAENWPDRAHHWFPSIDHPSDKATVQISVTAPERYEVVANGTLEESRSLLDGRRLTRWRENQPIPTYCMVFGAAEFAIRHAGSVMGVPLSYYAYPQDAAAAALKFARSSLALQFFSDTIGPYPYQKLAQVQSTTKIGGMENSSVIFYTESSFQPPIRENPVPHEIAHQWFGDSITQDDWDHLWISEGFATYFSALFYEKLEGPEALRREMARAAEAVRAYHKKRPAAIIDPDLTDLSGKLNALNYQKGAWALHMLRKILGDDTFFRGIRHYYSIYAGKNARTEDFQKVLESVSGKSLDGFFRQWFYLPGWPDYNVEWRWDVSSAQAEVSITQTQITGLFDMQLELEFLIGRKSATREVRVAKKTEVFRIPLPERPGKLEVDPGNWVLKTVVIVPAE